MPLRNQCFALDCSATSKLLTHNYHTLNVIQDVPRTPLEKKTCTSEWTEKSLSFKISIMDSSISQIPEYQWKSTSALKKQLLPTQYWADVDQ